jgi:parallel beta-helix repeat protein
MTLASSAVVKAKAFRTGYNPSAESSASFTIIAPPTNNWTFCAEEDSQCNFPGTKEVRYGTNGVYVSNVFTNGTLCANSVFGDPVYGYGKQCEYRDVSPSFDFAVSNSGSKSVIAGSSVANSVSATLVSGSAQPVSFSASGLPSGATASFSVASCTPSCSTLLTIATSGSTPGGDYRIVISSAGGGVTRTRAFTLSVTLGLTVATPTMMPNGGLFSAPVSVTMQTATSGASIYYTTDGSTPTQSSHPYTGTVTLTSSATVKSAAFKTGYNSSAEATASFTVTAGTVGSSTTDKTYYVAKNGNDNHSCSQAQNIGTPKLTISAGLACVGTSQGAGANKVVEVAAGTYNEIIGYELPSGTSWSNPFTIKARTGDSVTIKANNTNNLGVINGFALYTIVQGFIFDSSDTGADPSVAIGGGGGPDGLTALRLLNNRFINNAFSQHNIMIITNFASGIEIIGNKFETGTWVAKPTPGYAIYLASNSNIIDGNEFSGFPSWAIHGYSQVGSSNNNIVRNNYFHNFGSSEAGFPTSAILFYVGTGNRAYNNIIVNGPGGIQVGPNASNTTVYNNTIYSTKNIGIEVSGSNTIIKNNIAYQSPTPILDVGTGTLMSNNLTTDPMFVSTTDFRLQSGSPAVDAGANLSSTAITVDYAGGARPQGCCYDIGAYEQQ